MDRSDAIERLPEVHALALRLQDEGLEADVLAARLGVPVESVAPLLRLAEAKLARLQHLSALSPDARRDGTREPEQASSARSPEK